MKQTETILIAEDDRNLGYILSEYLRLNDYRVVLAKDGEEAIELFHQHLVDLCILDIKMPGMSGFEVGRLMKEERKDLPLIFLTARSLKIDKLKGFGIGADDYIVKPVDEEELMARIRAVLRRVSNVQEKETHSPVTLGEYHFDPVNQYLKYDGEVKRLTAKESDLLALLYDHRNRLIERRSILMKLWGGNDYFKRKSMDVFIYKLRKYLSSDPRIQISNVHGTGFILECP